MLWRKKQIERNGYCGYYKQNFVKLVLEKGYVGVERKRGVGYFFVLGGVDGAIVVVVCGVEVTAAQRAVC